MRHATRRRWDIVLLGAGSLVVGAAASIGALAADTERIGEYWTHAAIAADGRAQVIEVIDYDFGFNSRHGILRDIPDVDPEAPIVVSSPTAPDDLRVTTGFGEVSLRIGDADTTIRGRHRYRIDYPLDTLVSADRISWNAIGLDWPVPINNAEIHLTAPNELIDLDCARGERGSVGGCDVIQVSPGHLLVDVSGLGAGDGVTVFASRGAPLATLPRAPTVPDGPADDPGSHWLLPGLAGFGVALVAAGVTSMRVRVLGREQVWEGVPTDVAFGPPTGTIAGVQLLDHEQLAEMATVEFESPRDLSAAAGGIIHAEGVESRHQIAWLIESAIRDEIVLDEGDGDLALVRGSAVPHPAVAATLDAIFDRRDRVELGSYDKEFAAAWQKLAGELEDWRAASGLWEPKGHKRRRTARILGVLALVVGLGTAALGGALAGRAGPIWILVVALGGLVAGAGIAALVRAWELPVRTPEGSARWLQVESFRRFIAGSEGHHAEAAARMGLLRHYTAWAVALDEVAHWEKAVEAAAAVPGSSAFDSTSDLHFVALTPALSSATTSTFTAPSSSGGGGGGGAGGGGGGGGGGSW
ncbi:MAG: DUF2207 domain-containing protein [Acidimicrobiia bacterium]|nr:DUF2207 domain-containing protein [Acidimicrobiia bacterium]